MIVERPWRLSSAVAFTLLVLGVNLVASLAAREILTHRLPDLVTALLVGACLTAASLVVLAVAWLVAASHGITFAESVALRRPRALSPAAWIIPAVAGAVAARLFAVAYATTVASMRLELPGMDADPLLFFPGGAASAVVLVAVVVLVAPFAEEVAFRGVLLPALGAHWGSVVAVLGSSALFALIHLSPYLFVPILVASLVFGWLFVRFESLWPAFLCHALFNGAAVILALALRGNGVL